MTPTTLIAGIAAIFAVLFLYGALSVTPDVDGQLRSRYLSLMRLGRVAGEAQLAERLETLSAKHPGHTYRWYLTRLIRDLERAKR